jgi:hypothetical protein
VVFVVWLASWISSPLTESQVSLQFDSSPLTESLAFINPSCMHNFIHVQLVNKLQIPSKNIHNTRVEGENVQSFKELKITMEKYVLHSYFHAIDMADVDIVLGYPWME